MLNRNTVRQRTTDFFLFSDILRSPLFYCYGRYGSEDSIFIGLCSYPHNRVYHRNYLLTVLHLGIQQGSDFVSDITFSGIHAGSLDQCG
jgi:hypothetical protein